MANVPLIGPRSRYLLVGLDPAWIFQSMAAGQSFNKKLPRTAADAAPDLDPVVEGGKATLSELTEGGVFDRIATAKKSHIVEAIENPGSATIDIVRLSDLQAADPIEDAPSFRALPTAPFRLSPGETIRADGGATGGSVGVLIREASEAVAG